jgi:hypothetical protein
MLAPLATAPASRASRPNAPPASVLSQRRAMSGARHVERPHRSRRSGGARQGERHVAGIERLALRGGALAGLAGLILAPFAAAPAVEGLAADRATGISPGAAARHVEGRRTARHRAPRASRSLAGLAGLAGLDRAPLGFVAASRPRRRSRHRHRSYRSRTACRGARHVAASSGSRWSARPGSPGLDARRPPPISPAGSTPRWWPLDRLLRWRA